MSIDLQTKIWDRLDSPRGHELLQSGAIMALLEETLRESFGLAEFHPWQREAISELLGGSQRVLVVAPTGGGKSLCYQLPAAVLGGTSVVVSPLIALMDDQVRALRERGIAATYLASTLEVDELRERERDLERGRYKLVYVAPERLRRERMVALLRSLNPPLVAIDEAHCISQWGHDFRPDYLRLGELLEQLTPDRVLACTATATPTVRDEILVRLGMDSQRTTVVLRGFARPNLHLEVEEIDGLTERRRRTVKRVSEALKRPHAPAGAAIIYAGTRKLSERLATELSDGGWSSLPYHAGLEPSFREEVSARFARRELDVVVATNAFGMGIDRPDIRLVLHVQAPGSIEQYYQEVGRAGRDGQPAHGVLLSGAGDFGLRRRLIDSSEPADPLADASAYRQRQWQMFLDLMRYVEAGSCRHDFILRYFGDERETLGGCGHCDMCELLELAGLEGEREVDDHDALLVRKALSGVARVRGRAGLNALAASLHGSNAQRLSQLGLDQLSTHGLLSDRPQAWIVALLRRLMTAGLVDLTATDFPVPFLTERGVATMKSELPVQVLPPGEHVGSRKKNANKKKRASKLPAELSDGDRDLFEALRSERANIASGKGVPAYVVCHDRTLREIASSKPRSLAALEEMHGMGPARMEAYGPRLLEVVLRDC